MPLNSIPYPSDLGEWSRQKDGTFKERMSMTPEELRSLQTSIKTPTRSKFDSSRSARGQSEVLFESIKTEVLKAHRTLLGRYEDAWPVRILIIAYVENRVAYEKRSQRLKTQRQQSRAIAQAIAGDRVTLIAQGQTPMSGQESTSAAIQDPPLAAVQDEAPLANAHDLSERDKLEMMVVLQAAVLRPHVTYPSASPRMRPATGLFTARPADEIATLDATTELDVFTRLLSFSSVLDPMSRLYELSVTWAAKEDSVLALHVLYANRDTTGAAINATLYSGMNALRIAAFYGAIKCVRWLLVMGADPNSVPYEGEMIPHCSCFEGERCNHMEIMLEFLHHGVPYNYEDLRHASRAGSLENVKTLLSRGIGIGIEDSLYSSSIVLWDSLRGGHAEIAKYLIEYGVAPNALHLAQALFHNLLDVAAIVIEKDPYLVHDMTSDQVSMALESGRKEIADYLIQRGVPLNKFSLSLVSKYGWPEIAEQILSTLEPQFWEVDSAFYVALNRGHADIVMLFLPFITCSYAHLQLASRLGLLAAVKVILGRGIPINSDNKSQSALVCAHLGGHSDTIAFLTMSGAVFSPQDLVPAAASGKADVVHSILRSGANFDSHRIAALEEAINGGFSDIVNIIMHEASPYSLYSKRDSLLEILLYKSVYSRHIDLAQLLIDCLPHELSLADLNELMGAASASGSGNALNLIVSRYPHALDAGSAGDGRYRPSALCVATRCGHTHAAKFLIEHGAAFVQEDLVDESNLADSVPVSIMPTVVASGTSADSRLRRKNAPVYEALSYGMPAIAEFLIRQGPASWIDGPFDSETAYEGTLLQIAIEEGYLSIVEALLDRGAREFIDADGCEEGNGFSPPLQLALDNLSVDGGADGDGRAAVELLLKHGADVSKLERPEKLKELLTPELLSSLHMNTLQQIQALGYIPAEFFTVDVNDTQVPDDPSFDSRYLPGVLQPLLV